MYYDTKEKIFLPVDTPVQRDPFIQVGSLHTFDGGPGVKFVEYISLLDSPVNLFCSTQQHSYIIIIIIETQLQNNTQFQHFNLIKIFLHLRLFFDVCQEKKEMVLWCRLKTQTRYLEHSLEGINERRLSSIGYGQVAINAERAARAVEPTKSMMLCLVAALFQCTLISHQNYFTRSLLAHVATLLYGSFPLSEASL